MKYHPDMTLPKGDEIFVFGSNEAGIHGSGSAKVARDLYGAKLGVGLGVQGRSFALPTKDWFVETLPLDIVKHYVDRFIAYSRKSGDLFFITRIGCGLAGYTDSDIAPMFIHCGSNCNMPEEWRKYLT